MDPAYLDFMVKALEGKYARYTQRGLSIEVYPWLNHIYNPLPVKVARYRLQTGTYAITYRDNQDMYGLLAMYYKQTIHQLDGLWVGTSHQDGFTVCYDTSNSWEVSFYGRLIKGALPSMEDAQLFVQNASRIMDAPNWVLLSDTTLYHKHNGLRLDEKFYGSLYKALYKYVMGL